MLQTRVFQPRLRDFHAVNGYLPPRGALRALELGWQRLVPCVSNLRRSAVCAIGGDAISGSAPRPSGRLIDRHGGRDLLAASNLVIAAGLLILAAAHSIAGLVIAWTVLGVGIGMGLYDPAFATLTWLYGRDARPLITGITLIAGFASTIGWPLSALFLHEFGWRTTCLIWAGLNMVLAAPVNWLAIPRHGMPAALPQAVMELTPTVPPRAAMPILAFFFAATWFVQGAMAAHLPGLLQAAGASATAASAAASLVGPAQVAARIVEFGLLRSFHPISSARLASALHPIGGAFLVAFGVPGIIAFALLHGAGNGMITIAKGRPPSSGLSKRTACAVGRLPRFCASSNRDRCRSHPRWSRRRSTISAR